MDLFTHLEMGDEKWDGHTTEEKYKRLNSLGIQIEDKVPKEINHE